MNLRKAYNNFFRLPKTGFQKSKSKHSNKNAYTTNNPKSFIAIGNGYIKPPPLRQVTL